MKLHLRSAVIVCALVLFCACPTLAADNSRFYGTYAIHFTIAACAEGSEPLILGGNANRMAEWGYIYIPASPAMVPIEYSYTDVDGDLTRRIVSIAADTVTIETWANEDIPDVTNYYRFVLAYTNSYNTLSISGNCMETDPDECDGAISGTGTRVGWPVCTCDLNKDGRCNMLDWQVFGQNWGSITCNNPGVTCLCDLNKDGRCNMLDWQLFGQSWGRADCPPPAEFFYGTYTMQMNIDSCSTQSFTLTIGNDASRKGPFGGEGLPSYYLYVPAGESSMSYSFDEDGEPLVRTVILRPQALAMNETWDEIDEYAYHGQFLFTFTADGSSFTLSGNVTEADPSNCEGSVTGSGTRISPVN